MKKEVTRVRISEFPMYFSGIAISFERKRLADYSPLSVFGNSKRWWMGVMGLGMILR